MTSHSEFQLDRRLFLGGAGAASAAGAATLVAQGACAQEAKPAGGPAAPAFPTPPSKKLSDTIADFVVGFDPKSVPPLAFERARLAFIDTLAVMLAGSREEGSQIACEMVREEGAAQKVSVVGQSFRTTAQLAALANGVAAHIMDYDFSSLLGQPTSPIIPALLPLAESTGATPAEVTAAFMVGFEICLRFARAAPQHSVVGWHAVSSIGTIGAAMACARLAKVPRENIPDILGIAASLSNGLSANFGTMTKPLHSGIAARNAILAVSLGRAAFTSNAAALENPDSGYFRAFDRGMNISYEPFADLGRRNELVERSFSPKRYPCGGLGHTAIDATLELRNEINVADVTAIKAGITKRVSTRIGDKYPTSVESAKFSMPYVAAYTALYGPPMISAFTEEAIRDEKVKALARKVAVVIDPEFADVFEESPSRITVTLANGRTVERARYYASGTPQVPFTKAQVEEKFFFCAERSIDKAAATKLFAFLNRFDQERSLVDFWGLVKRA
jgi:2-methylcitrate dehydratase PrpD